jgi:Protein of unknown function (DUF5818)
MNRITRTFVSGLTAGLFAGVITLAASAQPVSGMAAPMPLIQAPQQPQTPQQEMPQTQTNKVATFSGTIVKTGDSYSLRDSSGAVYRLDDSSQASKFEGKDVKVVGQLDPQTHTIHVSSIEGGA